MGKTVLQRKTSPPVAQDELDRSLAVFAAKKQFVSAAVNMGWQLGLTVIIPVIIGVKLDDHFHSSPSYTLAALFLSVGGVVLVVKNTIRQVQKDQTNQYKEGTA